MKPRSAGMKRGGIFYAVGRVEKEYDLGELAPKPRFIPTEPFEGVTAGRNECEVGAGKLGRVVTGWARLDFVTTCACAARASPGNGIQKFVEDFDWLRV